MRIVLERPSAAWTPSRSSSCWSSSRSSACWRRLLLPAVQAARESARNSTCRNNLKQIGLRCTVYHAQHGMFPEGARMHARSGQKSIGWHVLVLPHMDQRPLYAEYRP